MYKIAKSIEICIAHHLPEHLGKCHSEHGHNMKFTVEIEGPELFHEGSSKGMLFDYYDLGLIMKEHIDCYDHKDLNKFFENPTSENIARELFYKMAGYVSAKAPPGARLSKVLVSETGNTVAEYSQEN